MSDTWFVTKGDAIEMYARFFSARYKRTAAKRARETADQLKRKGDESGYVIWNEVAEIIDHRSNPDRYNPH